MYQMRQRNISTTEAIELIAFAKQHIQELSVVNYATAA